MLKDKNCLEDIVFDSEYKDSDIAIVGIAFDGTCSYKPGARFAPQAIRNDLYGLEAYSPYLDKDLSDYNICDLGDIELSFGNTILSLKTIKQEIKSILDDNKKTFVIGGEHLISCPIIENYADKYEDLVVIQFDAHTDLREDYLGEKLSHATVMRLVHNKLGDGRIFQFGIRSGTREEFAFANKHTHFCKFDLETLNEAIKEIGNRPVYVTMDLDVLDPSIFCGTGTPEAGGITFKELMDGIILLNGLNIVGADIVELSPHYDQSGVSTAVACKVMRELLLAMA